MKLANLKIGVRLGISYFFILILMTAVTATGVFLLDSLGDEVNYMLDDAIAKDRIITEWHNQIQLNAASTMAIVNASDKQEQIALEKKIKDSSDRISQLLKVLDAQIRSAAGKELYVDATAKREVYRQVRDEMLHIRTTNNVEQVRQFVSSKVEPSLNEYLASIQKLSEFQEKKAADVMTKVRGQGKIGQYVLGGLLIVALLVGVVSAIWTTRSITRPLHTAISAAETVARGDLTGYIEVSSNDETGQLLQALKNMNDSLVRIVSEVRSGTDTIATASNQISTGNLDLSSRTEQQASSLEETASSMEELTSTVKQNADNARQANSLAMSASDVASKGGAVVSQVVDTMGSINESAKKIVDIIGVIDGIAFQTNILALNAAVEAARAGEQGRGFAVVAAEVRNLAQRSAAAAKEIKTLINDSVEKVDAGTKLVDQAGATMDEVVGSVKRVGDIISEIAAASREQSSGIEQINTAITQMDEVTQQNASLVEEAAAAAESLSEQAGTLLQLVSVFKVDGTAPSLSRPVAAVPSASVTPMPKKAQARRMAQTEMPRVAASAKRLAAVSNASAGGEWEEF